MKYFKNKKNSFSIFLFHGVIEKKNKGIRNYNSKHITKKKFLKIIKFLKRKGNCLSLDELFDVIKYKKDLPKNSFAITFDDGFENNYKIAVPILNKYNLKTTFYFSTQFVEKNLMSWIDMVEYAFEKSKQKFIFVPWKKKPLSIDNFKKKKIALEEIRKVLKNKNDNNVIQKFVKDTFIKLNVKEISSLNGSLDKKISWKFVRKLNKSKLFTVGGHSHRHISLTSINFSQARNEIDKSFRLFKKKIGLNLKHYSYPEGQRKDFNSNIIEYLKKKGIKICPTAISGYNSNKSSPFRLRRISINV